MPIIVCLLPFVIAYSTYGLIWSIVHKDGESLLLPHEKWISSVIKRFIGDNAANNYEKAILENTPLIRYRVQIGRIGAVFGYIAAAILLYIIISQSQPPPW
jgi:hypothetical protein